MSSPCAALRTTSMPKRAIKLINVRKVFDAKQIRRLHEVCGHPEPIDLTEFRKRIHAAVRIFARETQTANNNAVHREIELLHRAADKRKGQAVASLLQNLSPRTAELLKRRASRLGTKL